MRSFKVLSLGLAVGGAGFLALLQPSLAYGPSDSYWDNNYCGIYGCYPQTGGLTLNPAYLNLRVGEYAVVSLSSGINMAVYPPEISSYSNSGVAWASISNSQMTVTGSSQGHTTITVCLRGGSTCNSLGVNVDGGNSGGQINFSDNNPVLSAGQTRQITISGGNGYGSNSYYVSSNSNSNAVYAYVSSYSNVLILEAKNSGSASITVCQSNYGSNCGTLYATVNGNSGNNQVYFSQNSLNLGTGQSQQVYIYNNSGITGSSYYVSNNTNSSAVTAGISGSALNLYGQNSGYTSITVCMSGYNYCGTLSVTVSGYGNSSLSLSQNSISLNAGQSATVSIYGSGSYYISNNSNSSVVSASVSGSSISLYGNSSGSASVTVCQNNNYACATLAVTVGGGTLSLSQTSVTLSPGQTAGVYISGNHYSQNYYISSNSNSSAVSASVSGNNLSLYGQNQGSSAVTVCASGGSSCASVYVTVGSGSAGNLYFTTSSLTQPTVGQYYNFQLNASGGTAPYTFTLVNGNLPAGLSLSALGQISGTPQNNNAASFSVRVTDSYGRSGQTGFVLTPGGVLGISAFSNGLLIKEDNTVYLVYKNTRTPFASAEAFLGLGYKFENVGQGSGLNLSEAGYIVKTDKAAHPWGSWVKSGQTVYFVHELGLIPVSSYEIFLNNGGADNLVVPANSYDFQLPILSVMIMNDTRLR